ncbi:hypothetical protein ACJRO7_003821 [Eucalyptus globulus]|uniref:HMA domain-containing protein n=1 Tax=Eucalyptus globulus TaxID=34317 RepID=A0ABD3IXK7_EUCGL
MMCMMHGARARAMPIHPIAIATSVATTPPFRKPKCSLARYKNHPRTESTGTSSSLDPPIPSSESRSSAHPQAKPESPRMGKKKGNKGGGDAKQEAKSKGGEVENKKKEGEDGFTVVLKMDMHCGGCADKIVKWAKNVKGVEKAKAEWEANKLTVRGEMDPWELREELEGRTKKKVEVVSPQLPKKDKDKDKDSKSSASPDGNNKKAKDKKAEDKKPKEPPVSTAVLKLELHCAGCIDKIYKTATKVKGVQSIQFDKEKDLVAATGTMDAKALVESLKEKMKRPVEVVQPKKDKDGGGKDGGGKDGGGGGGGGGKKNKKGGKEEGGDDGGYDGVEESYGIPGEYFGENRMEYYGLPPGYGYNYAYMYGNPLHAPQMFSDENPNACHIM